MLKLTKQKEAAVWRDIKLLLASLGDCWHPELVDEKTKEQPVPADLMREAARLDQVLRDLDMEP